MGWYLSHTMWLPTAKKLHVEDMICAIAKTWLTNTSVEDCTLKEKNTWREEWALNRDVDVTRPNKDVEM